MMVQPLIVSMTATLSVDIAYSLSPGGFENAGVSHGIGDEISGLTG